MTESLLLKLFVGASKPLLLDTPLVRTVFQKLKDSLRDDGAFYGVRVTSWATAHALSALASATSSSIKTFPDRPPEARQTKLKGLVIIGTICLVVLASVFQWRARFEPAYAITLNFALLVVLLVSDFIHEDSFVRVMLTGIRAAAPGKNDTSNGKADG